MSLNEHEKGFLQFVEPLQSRRLSALLEAGSRARPKLRDMLAHDIKLDPKYSRTVASDQSTAEDILSLMQKNGARRSCFVMSEIDEIDGQTLDLLQALRTCVGADAGTFISSIPGKLGYFEFEDPGERYLLLR